MLDGTLRRGEQGDDAEDRYRDERHHETHTIGRTQLMEVCGVEGEVANTLHDPSCGERSIPGSRQGGPDRGDHQRDEEHADVADEMLVVRPACAGDPGAPAGEVVEEGTWEQGSLDADGPHEHGDDEQRPVRSRPRSPCADALSGC